MRFIEKSGRRRGRDEAGGEGREEEGWQEEGVDGLPKTKRQKVQRRGLSILEVTVAF